MALELGPHGIRVNCVNPTVIMTEMAKVGWSDPAKANEMLSKIPLRRYLSLSIYNQSYLSRYLWQEI